MPTCSYEPDKKMYFRANLNPTVRTARTLISLIILTGVVNHNGIFVMDVWNFMNIPK